MVMDGWHLVNTFEYQSIQPSSTSQEVLNEHKQLENLIYAMLYESITTVSLF
jgi:hypothetical protein